ALMSVAMLAIVAVDAWGEQKLEITQKRSDAKLRAAAAEIQVGNILASLPDEFQVINDLATPDGDIGHLVAGPTGIFLLEARNWRGTVSDNGKGELLLNGAPTEMPFIRHFTELTAKFHARVAPPAPETHHEFKAIFVFTAAVVATRQSATGDVICLSDDQLYSYIVESNPSLKLKPDVVDALVRAFLNTTNNGKIPLATR
ncbi:MAG TPA: nuclease-related domain-containing protein, partial [Candidatus Binatia bacterium]|nr:nuclease-related domain-containing protein [Candidatus Binatia bacterium]